MRYTPTAVPERAQRTAIRAWQILSSASTAARGEEISLAHFDAADWLVAPPRSTVLGALLDDGRYEDAERGRAMADIDPSLFDVPWWYRSTFTTKGGGRTCVRLDGVLHRADVFVNGRQVATAEQTAGAYTVSEVDITDLAGAGVNSLALKVYPGNPEDDLSISWVDWAQRPPDNNMGIWRDVVVQRTGDVRLGPAVVTSDLSLPGLESADITVSFEVANLSHGFLVAAVRGTVSGGGRTMTLARDVPLQPGERVTVTFGPAGTPALRLEQPAVWWPVGEGAQPLYDLQVSVAVDGLVSDQLSTSFGVRTVTSYVADGGGRRFVVNGRELQIVGGGWAPDLFLRYDHQRLAAEMAYALHLGLNALRLEGKLENEEFFEMTDACGLMVLPGWECCSKWEVEKREQAKPWSERDFVVAQKQMASEAVLLRNHPSVIGFLIGSDYAPPERTAALYVEALAAKGWSLPVVSSATVEGSDAAGSSGMKMTGPYAYVPPGYWYSRSPEHGGAIGFNSETSAGNTIPRLASLRRMLSEPQIEDLWCRPEAKQFHAAPASDFDNLAVFHRALAGRYGRPTSTPDFCRKAQLANYETVRAQFEAYRCYAFSEKPATGVIYWMLNSPWPSLNWQLYDWYLGTGGAYFGARKANEVLHPVYNYGTGSLQIVNSGRPAPGPWRLSAVVRDIAGTVASEQRFDLSDIPGRGTVDLGDLVVPAMDDPTYFLVLSLGRDGTGASRSGASRNVYWLSSTPDVLDWEQGRWHYTPLSQFADLTGLERLPAAEIVVSATPRAGRAGRRSVQVLLRNTSPAGAPAVGLHVSVLGDRRGGGAPIEPVLWDDNDVTLFGGEEITLSGCFPVGLGGTGGVEVEGFNVSPVHQG